jgi:hypothetical protein
VSAIFLSFRAIENGFLIDRYFIGLTTACGLLVLVWLRDRVEVSVFAGAAAVAVMALATLVIVLDGDAYDSVRWSVAQRAVADGIPPEQVSAGFEWLGANHRGPIGPSENILGFPDRCIYVAEARLSGPGHRLIARRTYAPVGSFLQRSLWIYREQRRCGSS